jgi:hypothetical protein
MEIEGQQHRQVPMAADLKQASITGVLQGGAASLAAVVVPRLLHIQDALAQRNDLANWDVAGRKDDSVFPAREASYCRSDRT